MVTYRKPDTIRRRGRRVGALSVAVAAFALAAAGCSNRGARVADTPIAPCRRRRRREFHIPARRIDRAASLTTRAAL